MGSDYHATSERPAGQPASDSAELDHHTAARPASRGEEGREQIIARRRAAQLVWRRARQRVDQVGRAMAAVERGPQAATSPDHRLDLEQARLEERSARSLYSRVAGETGALLSRLHRAKTNPTM